MHNLNKQYSFYSKNKKFELHTSSQEIRELFIAWLMISIAFAIARSSEIDMRTIGFFTTDFIILILISAVTVGAAFLMHELAHKIIAQRYKFSGYANKKG